MNRKPTPVATLLALALALGCACACQTPNNDDPPSLEEELAAADAAELENGVGARVFVVEREAGALSIYDLAARRLLPKKIQGFGNMRHATMVFSPSLSDAFVATRSGKLSRINLRTLERTGDVSTSDNSIDIAISHDGRWVATAEYAPGGVTVLDARTLEVAHRFPSEGARMTGVVDAPGNRFVAVRMEIPEVWVIDPSRDPMQIVERIPLRADGEPYDAMITPDGRYYIVGHLNQPHVSLVDLRRPRQGARTVSLVDPQRDYAEEMPVKLPHMASWAVAGDRVFVPLVGEPRLAVLDRETWELVGSVPLRGHPVYAVRSPMEHEIWVSFSGEANDAYIQVVDVETLEVTRTIQAGGRIYHMDFTPRGSHVLVTANRDDALVLIDATTYEIVDRETVRSPSGVFGPWRAFRIGL